MSTASTKSHNRKKNRRSEGAPSKKTPPEVVGHPNRATFQIGLAHLQPLDHGRGSNSPFVQSQPRAFSS